MGDPVQSTRQRRSDLRRKLPLLLALTLVAWTPSLRTTSWTADDPQVLLESPVVNGSLPAHAAFNQDYTYHAGSSGQWRPAAALSLRIDHSLYGPSSSRGWHLSNLLIHLLTVGLAASLALKLLGRLPSYGLAFFAIHPILTDSVAWASGRPSLLCILFGLLGAHLLHSCIAARRPPLAIAAASFAAIALPLLAKEDGLLFTLLVLIISAKCSLRVLRYTLAGGAIAVCAWLTARGYALDQVFPAAAEPLMGGAPLYERVMTAVKVIAESIKLSISPVGRPPNYELGSLPSLLGSAAIITAAGAALWLANKAKPIPTTHWLLPLLTLTPFLHLVPIGEAFAPRFAHIYLLSLIPLADELLRRLVSLLPIAVLATLLGVTWSSIGHYKDAESYWLASLQHHPASPVAWNALGLARADDGRHEEAISSFKAAITQEPSHSRAWSNLARSLLAIGRTEEAEAALGAAVRSGPNNPIAHTNWALHLERGGDHVGAREAFIRATQLRPGLQEAWAGVVRTERRLGRAKEAELAERRLRSLGTR